MSYARFPREPALPTLEELVRASARPVEARRRAPTVLTLRARGARSLGQVAWPVFLCGFLSGIFGGIALVKSPLGQRPALQHVLSRANAAVFGLGR